MRCQNSILLYPSPEAVELSTLADDLKDSKEFYNLFLIDGTWPQAKAIYHSSPLLHEMRQVSLSSAALTTYLLSLPVFKNVIYQSKSCVPG